ncbi:hypothetical protein DL96DRAFT_1505741 [Flagelloscypha sp. PMI_526]|nr:hypothetical protein DL96DRAFT_1505741 [Flagelloscypha sp. PMI_526]
MGLAVGGKIEQKIYFDTRSPEVYDEDNAARVYIHTVSTAAWEMITGVVCPLTPVTPALYKALDYPWFTVYDEHLLTVQPTGHFGHVQSVHQTDYVSSNEIINPKSPPNCARHIERTSTCIARPCNHPACGECFGASLFTGWKCPFCNIKVGKYVGFDRPIPKIGTDGGSWWEAESQIQGITPRNATGQVITLLLEEDRVSKLHGVLGNMT